ncbi:MAG: class I SAM-dependent methyltransferase [Alphaproteobacteria bacterium]|nr:class I SAM-dependent methyltransferase [Alphaproteobacteria bacterium]
MDAATRNLQLYNSDQGVGTYAAASEATPVERQLFQRFAADFGAGLVLDLGVGAGRTTAALAALSGRYHGIDYAPAMVAACQRRFAAQPELMFSHGDARRLDGIADGAAAAVVFSFNGIDSVGPDDRLAVLAAVRRVLRPGGLFLFSAHNRAFQGIPRSPGWQWTLRPRGLARQALMWWNHLRVRRDEVETPDYAMLNDIAHHFASLFYYIDRDAQCRQLAAAGFSDCQVFNSRGEMLPATAVDTGNDPHLHYAVRRPMD